jgi:hypothetical protein
LSNPTVLVIDRREFSGHQTVSVHEQYTSERGEFLHNRQNFPDGQLEVPVLEVPVSRPRLLSPPISYTGLPSRRWDQN